MRLRWILGLVLAGLWAAGSPAARGAAGPPVVHAVLFWMDGCPHCEDVMTNVLPPLEARYGEQLDLQRVEVATAEDVDRLFALGAALGLPQERVAVPFLLIGDHVLVGAREIPAELPGLIIAYLAAGGVDYPAVPGLAEWLPEGAPIANRAPLAAATGAARSNGFVLAYVVIAGMAAALAYAGLRLIRAFREPPAERSRGRLDLALPILLLIGLGVAGYLTYVETQLVPALCGPIGDCNAVQASPYARVFRVVPVGVLGLGGYVAMLAAWAWGRYRDDRVAGFAPLALFGLALVGTLFSLYLTYLEPFVIRAVCIWCLTSAVVITLVLLLSLGPMLTAAGSTDPAA